MTADVFWLILAAAAGIYFVITVIYAGIGRMFHMWWAAVALWFLLLCLAGRYGAAGLQTAGSLITAAGAVPLAVTALWVRSQEKTDAEDGADYLIVLGAGLNGDVIPPSLRLRLDVAADYIRRNKKTRVIVSGGQGPDELVTEASAMKQYLVNAGIDEGRITQEDRSVNTAENIAFCRQLMVPPGRTVLVTNSFHIGRSLLIARKQGLTDVQGIGAGNNAVMALNYYFRESLAVILYKLTGRI